MELQHRIVCAANQLRDAGIKPESIRLANGDLDVLKSEAGQMMYPLTEKREKPAVERFQGLPIVEATGGQSAVCGWRGVEPIAMLLYAQASDPVKRKCNRCFAESWEEKGVHFFDTRPDADEPNLTEN